MSCDFHKGPCDCWAPQVPASAVVCGCLGIEHDPGCRYYATQEAVREKTAAEQYMKDLNGAATQRIARDAQVLRGTAGLEFPAPQRDRFFEAVGLKAPESPLAALKRRRANYITYMRDRIEDEDWHGVSDAANDLRELDCEIRCVEAGLPEKVR